MRVAVHSETEARKASNRRLLRDGWYPARIVEADETMSQAGNDMIRLQVRIRDKDDERELPDWLLGNERGALKMRHAAEAVGALAKYETGEIGQEDLVGHDVHVKIVIEKRRGHPDQNRIVDYGRP